MKTFYSYKLVHFTVAIAKVKCVLKTNTTVHVLVPNNMHKYMSGAHKLQLCCADCAVW